MRAKTGRILHTANPSDVPSPPLSPSPAGGRGGLWSAEAQLPPMLKLTLQHSEQVSARLTPLPPCGRGAGGEGRKWAHPAHSEPKRCTLTPFVPLSRRRERGIMECGSEASAYAEADASALQTGQRTAHPSPTLWERDWGVRAESGRILHTANPSDVPSPPLSPSPAGGRGGLWSAEAKLPPMLKLTLQHSKRGLG